MNETIAKFGYPETLVRAYEHWVVLVRPSQPTLGSLVLAAKSQATEFHALPDEAFAELKHVVTAIEKALADFVGYAKINYLMLMMVDPDVHYHVIPRYPGSRSFKGLEYRDTGWPGPPALEPAIALDDAARDALVAALRQGWQQAEAQAK